MFSFISCLVSIGYSFHKFGLYIQNYELLYFVLLWLHSCTHSYTPTLTIIIWKICTIIHTTNSERHCCHRWAGMEKPQQVRILDYKVWIKKKIDLCFWIKIFSYSHLFVFCKTAIIHHVISFLLQRNIFHTTMWW